MQGQAHGSQKRNPVNIIKVIIKLIPIGALKIEALGFQGLFTFYQV